MDLFPSKKIEVKTDLPEVFITAVDPDGAKLPEPTWCRVAEFVDFKSLISPATDEVVIVACPDNAQVAAQIRLVADNGPMVGASLVLVKNVVDYVPSGLFESSLWATRVVDFDEWRLQAEEAERDAELASRASRSRDEVRMLDNARSDGTFKEVQASVAPQVEDEAPEAPVF